jgi:glycosyltransferase involved in cell wall biosynthesis
LLAFHLREAGVVVTQRTATPRNVLRSLITLARYDAIIGTTRAGAIAGLVLAPLGRVPFVVDQIDPFEDFEAQVSWPVAKAVLLIENLAIRYADHVLYVYDSELPRIRRYTNDYLQTDFGVEYDQFADPDPVVLSRAKDRLPEGVSKNVLLYVGGLDPIYHIEEMMQTMEYLENWTLIVLGTGTLEDRVRKAATDRDDIVFLGTVPHEEIPGFYHVADVGLCLVDDARTLKVLEYAAASLPVVHLDGAARERFGDAFEYCDAEPRDIASAVRRSVDLDTSDADLHDIARAHSWAAISEDYLTVLDAVLENRTK